MDHREVAKEIVVTAIQNGMIPKTHGGTLESAQKTAQTIAEFYKIIYKSVLNPDSTD